MVHAHAANRHFERPDPTSIGAMSGAMVLHLIGVALLLVPLAMPTAPARVERPAKPPIVVQFYPVQATPTPVELPPIPTPPVINNTAPPPTATPAPVDVPTATQAVNSTPVTPPESADTGVDTSVVPVGPIEVASLVPIVATGPKYPIGEVRRGIEGTVYLRILVGTDGLPMQVDIERGSGSRNLDRAAREHVLKKWRFEPAMHDGASVQAWCRVPIVFSLASA